MKLNEVGMSRPPMQSGQIWQSKDTTMKYLTVAIDNQKHILGVLAIDKNELNASAVFMGGSGYEVGCAAPSNWTFIGNVSRLELA